MPEDPESVSPQPEGAPRFQRAERRQMEWLAATLDELLPEDHRARMVWAYTAEFDLEPLYESIAAVEGGPGRDPIDPRILLALWLYGTVEGVGSARAIERLCVEHLGYRWLCGGVGVNRDRLAAFRREQEEALDTFLTQSVTSLVQGGLVKLAEIAQDGSKIHANAGSSSARSRTRLRALHREAQQRVQDLKRELESDPGACTARQAAARKRAVREREARIARALSTAKKLEEERDKLKPSLRKKYSKQVRVSTTDPDARKQKMGDGGYRQAFTTQFATDMGSRVVVGVSVGSGNDFGQLSPMTSQLQQRYGVLPQAIVADTGYAAKWDIEAVEAQGCRAYVPPHPLGKAHHPKDSSVITNWKTRMESAEGEALYSRRASVAEWPFAGLRNRGLGRLPVRGKRAVKCVLLLQALVHNMMRSWSLRLQAA
jgi:transposase